MENSHLFAVITLVFASALLIPGVLAVNDAYISLTPDSLSICPCTTVGSFTNHGSDIEVSVTNEGPVADTYELYLEFPDSEWSGFIYSTEAEVTLGPGEEVDVVPLWITPSCSVLPGEYQVKIGARSKTTGEEKEKALAVEILNCHMATLSLPASGDTCMGATKVFQLNVTNYGKYEERFAPEASVNWATFSAEEVAIPSGQSRLVSMILEPPEDLVGIQSIDVSVNSLDSYAEDKQTLNLDVNDCYSFDIGLQPASQSICRGRASEYILRLTNTGSEQDQYSIYAPEWVSVAEDSVVVDPGKAEEIVLTATPSGIGEFKFNVTVISLHYPSYPDLSKSLLGTADAKECRGVALVVSPSSASICSQESVEYTVTVKNIGTVADRFSLEASVGSLEEDGVLLEPGASRIVKLTAGPGLEPGEKTVRVEAASEGVSDSDEAQLTVDNCYSASITLEPADVEVCPCSSVTFNAELKNLGKYQDSYSFSLKNSLNSGKLEEDVILIPGGEDSFSLAVPVSCDAQAGEYLVEAGVSSGNGVEVSKTVPLKVMEKDSCYSINLTPDKEKKETLVGKSIVFEISAKNTGGSKDSYTLSLSGPEWSYLGDESLELKAGEEKTVYLYASPTYGTELGEYPLRVSAVSGYSSGAAAVFVDVVLNLTETGANVSMNASMPSSGDTTGQFLGEAIAISWKIVIVTILALAIVVILITRFVILIR